MIYETFLETITNDLQQILGDEYCFTLRPLPKNNGVILDGLTIQGPEITFAPTIYLNPYYEQHLQGMSIQEILNDIITLYRTTPAPTCISEHEISHFDLLKHKVMFRTIHTESNQVLLSDIPHIPYLDLSIIFFLSLERNDSGQLTALIHNSHARMWKVSAEDLWNLAQQNTPLEYPAEIRSMTEMMMELVLERQSGDGGECNEEALASLICDDEELEPLYVLTNQIGLYGSACLIYRNVLKDFAERLKSDLIILPSSVHEVLLTPDMPGAGYEDLSEMVTLINQRDVAPEDRLSNQVYLYTRSDDQIRIMSHGKSTVNEVTSSLS